MQVNSPGIQNRLQQLLHDNLLIQQSLSANIVHSVDHLYDGLLIENAQEFSGQFVILDELINTVVRLKNAAQVEPLLKPI